MLKVDQHIYGKTKEKDFSTLAISVAIPKEDLKVLEKYSLYQLPHSLLYDEKAIKPKKYIYYKLNNESVVLGRGIDVGRDEFGRVGNFLFHNLIFKIKEFEILGLTPIELIWYFEEKNIFQDKPYEGKILTLDLKIDVCPQEEMLLPDILEKKKDLTDLLFYACFNREEIKDPIYINGDEKKIFDFMNKYFRFLPKRVWWSISYNTFWYKEPILPGIFFCCTDLKSCEIRPPSYSLKIDLEKEEYESKLYIKNEIKDEHAKYVSQKAMTDKQSLSCFYSQEELVMSRDWGKFIASYKDSPQDDQDIMYKYHKEDILKEVSQGNNTLLSAILKNMNSDDRNRIYKSNILIQRIIGDEILAKNFVEWFYDFYADDKRELYTIFLNNLWLFEILIEKITENKSKTNKNIEIFQALFENILAHKKRNDEEIEVRLFLVFCNILENMTDSNIDLSKTLKIIKKLPSSENYKVSVLSALITYKLGDNSKLISLIKEGTHQSLIYEILKKGIETSDFAKYK